MTVISFPGRHVSEPSGEEVHPVDPHIRPVDPMTPEDVALNNLDIAIELAMEVAGLKVTAGHLENMSKIIRFTMQIGNDE